MFHPPPLGQRRYTYTQGAIGLGFIDEIKLYRFLKKEQKKEKRESAAEPSKDFAEFMRVAEEKFGHIPEFCMGCEIVLGKQMIIKAIEEEEIKLTFPDLTVDARGLMRIKSYRALEKIKSIIDDKSLDDSECFQKIEAIIQVFEDNGSFSGRHDS